MKIYASETKRLEISNLAPGLYGVSDVFKMRQIFYSIFCSQQQGIHNKLRNVSKIFCMAQEFFLHLSLFLTRFSLRCWYACKSCLFMSSRKKMLNKFWGRWIQPRGAWLDRPVVIDEEIPISDLRLKELNSSACATRVPEEEKVSRAFVANTSLQ